MTTTVLTRGSDWGIFANHGVYANWGDAGEGADTAATEKMLGDLVVDRFHELCRENDIHAYWCPHTSEVIGNIGQDFDDEILDELREQATAETWSAWSNGEIDPIMSEDD